MGHKMKKTYRTLKPELVSLIHNIELSNSDWWEKTIQKLIIAILWLENKELTTAEIEKKLRDEFPITTNNNQISAQIQILCEKNILLATKNCFKISEAHKQEFERDLKKTEQITKVAKEKFSAILARECPSLDTEESWSIINRELFLPSVQQMGAKFYELLSGSKSDIDEIFDTENFLNRYSENYKAGIKSTITEYLSSKDKDVRAYILRYINATFALEASSLEERTIDLLKKASGNKVSFTIFVDSNFVFSLLGYHDNPFNDDATFLSNLVKEVSNKIATKFYIAPITVEETRAAIENTIEYYDDLKLSPNLANASLKIKHIGGFLRKLVEEVSNSNKTIYARDFYEPYKVDLLKILRAKNIELFNERLDRYTFDQNVIDDINIQIDYENEHFKENAKSYEKIKHDVTLWHFIKEKRPLIVESPSDANFWIVTVDFRFLGFDAFRRRGLGNSQPICVLPSQLIHILQFWAPRTSNLEEVLFESWMWPVIFQDFDPGAEKASIKILETLNRFEGFQDLPEEAISQMLLDNALRKRIITEKDASKQIELIKDALIQQLKETEEKNITINAKLEQVSLNLAKTTNNAKFMEEKLQDDLRAKDEQINTLISEVRKLSESTGLLQADLFNSKKEKEELERQAKLERKRDKERRKFSVRAIIYCSIALFTSTLLGYFISNKIGSDFTYTAIGLSFFALLIFILIINKEADENPALTEWKPIQKLRLFKNWLLGFLALVGTTLLGKAVEQYVWEPIKNILNK
jgi:hypothetical protein